MNELAAQLRPWDEPEPKAEREDGRRAPGGRGAVYCRFWSWFSSSRGFEDQTVEEVAWKTAVDAAPWLLGSKTDEGRRSRTSSLSACNRSRNAWLTTSATATATSRRPFRRPS